MDRNPLRRRTDRIESALRIALVLAFLTFGPLLTVWVGQATHVSGMREVRIGTPCRPHSANEAGVTTLRQMGGCGR